MAGSLGTADALLRAEDEESVPDAVAKSTKALVTLNGGF